ncbi:amino acid ABC transporter permease [Micromonospora cremea]|uniref:Amino acid ABC transporter membrane protein 2, PAAT family n=1 Tax=Micromonospora cremea TaxID=709881 RepID=A0A1N5UGD6_9ACTN|nr:amino acid ABC transporter permease [Micromonospora cremea]SIM59457.1 amino acid ABC transporter membrane protein 2, PAAT family [Micromonospora cremea]
MSAAPSILYDEPGPRARRRIRVSSAAAVVVILIALAVAALRLRDGGQFAAEKWSPLFDPDDESFAAVWQIIGRGLRRTLVAAALAIACSLAVGTLIAVARFMLGRAGRILLVGLVELLRGLPVVITIYFAARVLPDLGLTFANAPGGRFLWYLVIGLTAYNGVVIAEIIRAGVQALPRGQCEAASAIGLSRWQTLRLVLLPQAFRVMLPALISQVVVVLKDTSLAALILGQYPELLRSGNLAVQELGNPIQMFLVIAVMYVAVGYALSRLAQYTDRRLSRPERRARRSVSGPLSVAGAAK